jgi:hypothetical protein
MLFGDKNLFAIDYELIQHPYGDEYGLMLDSWGELHLWIHGLDVLELYESYHNNKIAFNYSWNLIMVVEWLAKNLKNIISDVEFPNNIQATNVMDYLEKSNALAPEFGTEEYWKWHEKEYDWLMSHWFRAAADGSNLPHLFFRIVDKNIEINWNNEGLFDDRNVFFINHEGCEYIDASIFCRVITDFINHFTNQFMLKYPLQIKEIISTYNLSNN